MKWFQERVPGSRPGVTGFLHIWFFFGIVYGRPFEKRRLEVVVPQLDEIRRHVLAEGEDVAKSRLGRQSNLEKKVAEINVSHNCLDIVTLSDSLQDGLGVCVGAELQRVVNSLVGCLGALQFLILAFGSLGCGFLDGRFVLTVGFAQDAGRASWSRSGALPIRAQARLSR